MKINQPVTNREQRLPAGKYIVSKTDLKGAITYVNDTFIEVSGFTEEELIGKNHNMVRHPDMPPAAFEWLWDTIKDGRPWRGLVKNRCKNGDFYWVEALVVPVRKDNKTIGYMSVRTAPESGAVQAAEALYAELNRTKKSVGKANFFQRIALRTKLIGLVLGILSAQGVCAAADIFGPMIGMDKSLQLIIMQASGATTLILGGLLMYMLHKTLTIINRIHKRLDNISQGDLTDTIPAHRLDELGKVNDRLIIMQTHLKVMMEEIADTAKSVSSNATSLSTEMADVYQASQRQSDSVITMASAMDEVSASIKEVSDSARQTSEYVTESNKALLNVLSQMHRSRDASRNVVVTVDDASQTMLHLFQSINQIGSITKSISEIADQTNLLALNAAIEAARAGESGRGFAVVADEVRKLAEKSRQQTVQIEQTVSVIQQNTQLAVTKMDDASQHVKETDAEMATTEVGLKDAVDHCEKINVMAASIASASVQQAAASDDITNNINSVSSAIENNVESIGNTRNNVSSLQETTEQLRTLIKFFKYIK